MKKDYFLRTIGFIAAALIGFGAFLDFGRWSYMMILGGIMLFLGSRWLGNTRMFDSVQSLEKIGTYRDYDICLIKNSKQQNQNIYMVMKKKKGVIVLDRGILDALSKEELEASYLHEIGHIHTWSPEVILCIKMIGSALCAMAFHAIIYDSYEKMIVYGACIGGVLLVATAMWLEKHIEYKADEYAINNGAQAAVLANAIEKIDQLNGIKKTTLTMGTHPETKKRIDRMKQLVSKRGLE